MADRDFRIDLLMRAHFEQAQSALDRANRQLDGIGRTMDRVNSRGISLGTALKGVAVGAVAATTAATAFMAIYIAKTIESEKVQAQLQARLKDTGAVAGRSLQQLNEQAAKLQAATTFDDESIGNAQAMLLIFTQIRGVNFDRTIEAATDLATVMHIDVADAAKVLGKALSDPAEGLGALAKAGVKFTDAQTEMIKKMMDAGQIAEAQSFILDKLQGTMGNAAEAARNTLGGALQALKNSFDNLLEGQAGDEGVVGTRNAIEELIKTLEDPAVKRGVDNTVTELFRIVDAGVRIIAKLGEAAGALREFYGDADKRSTTMLQNQREDLQGQAFAFQRIVQHDKNSAGALSSIPGLGLAAGAVGASLQLRDQQHLADLQRQIKEIDAILAQRARDEARPNFSNVVGGAVSTGDNPAPEGEGARKPTTGGGSKSDPDSDIKRRIDSLREETALLGQVKDGEDKASEAAKARYAVTEGEFKNKSPALKAQLVAAAEALDQKNADIEAEKKRLQAIEDSKKAYDDLLQGLRTPAEVAVDDAIAKLDTLNQAMQNGIATKGQYDKAQQRIADGLIGAQPGFQGLAPEVGGPFGELGKLDQATADEQKWYQDSLQRLAAYRAQKGASQAAADAEEERVEAEHQQRMKGIEASRQQANLALMSNFFGQIAQLQHSHNSKAAAVGKAAAIAQAIINTYQAATEAYKAMAGIYAIGPYLGAAAAAAAIAAGMANVAAIRSQPTGYAEGGYTGPGGKYQPAGVVHKGEGVLTQEEIAKLGGPSGFFALRQAIEDGAMRQRIYGWAGYADGGLVGARGPVANPDWGAMERTRAATLALQGGNRLSLYNLFDVDALAQKLANHPAMEKRIVTVASENGAAIRAEW